ncbi:hypothetical protein LSH36_40g03110 [Paralvinella palmiformis]|uniref:ATP synthase F1 subunit epsilon n=1 Tax=Paralvinella palmiformis TaxID=53620 RepID=A0AAD9NFC6_9ANNE|nr:hypothetical protein LSH36_40g03110 [Paralvinella palmiformis]
MALRLSRAVPIWRNICSVSVRAMSQTGQWGEGAGKGGGSGGAVRDAGGTFGKKQAAQEEQYFKKLQAEQLKKLKESVHDEIKYHKDQIEDHEEAIERHQKKLKDLAELEK